MNDANLKLNRYVQIKFEPLKYYLMAFVYYTTFDGRSRRKEFWYFAGINTIIVFFALALRLLTYNNQLIHIIDLSLALFCLATLIPTIAVSARRLNDIGRSKWLLLTNLIPGIGNFVFIIFMLTDSQMGYNKHGEFPKFSPIYF